VTEGPERSQPARLARGERGSLRLCPPALAVVAVWFVHAAWIDRLEVTKLALAVFVLSAIAAVSVLRSGRDARGLSVLALVLLLASLIAPGFVGARTEAWAALAAAGLALVLIRGAQAEQVGSTLALGAAALAALGIAQALGAEWFVAEVHAFGARRVMGTLGNPTLFGVVLAIALPFAVVRATEPRCAVAATLIVVGIAASGARTAWVMALPSLAAGWLTLPRLRFATLSSAGLALAIALSVASPAVDMGGRLDDLVSSGGTASGRLYLWRVHLSALDEIGPVGGGPQSFQRQWPAVQRAYLSAIPDDERFRSDLRHAHADPIELLYDWGWLGFALALWGLFQLLRPKRGGDRERTAARVAVIAALVGGLAFPVLFQTPSLLAAAAAAGILATPATPPEARSRGLHLILCALIGLAVISFWTGRHTASEYHRAQGVRALVAGDLDSAADRFERALRIEPRNALAAAMYGGILLESDPARALDLALRAARELPTDAVLDLARAARQRSP